MGASRGAVSNPPRSTWSTAAGWSSGRPVVFPRSFAQFSAFQAYHDLPTENDAFATEFDVQELWDEATATATPPPAP